MISRKQSNITCLFNWQFDNVGFSTGTVDVQVVVSRYSAPDVVWGICVLIGCITKFQTWFTVGLALAHAQQKSVSSSFLRL